METSELDGTTWVSLVTYEPDGRWESTPVWIEGRNGLFVVTSDREPTAVRRVRHDPVFEVIRCDLRGWLLPDAGVYRGLATVVEGSRGRRIAARRRRRWWPSRWFWRLVEAGEWLVGKRPPTRRVVTLEVLHKVEVPILVPV